MDKGNSNNKPKPNARKRRNRPKNTGTTQKNAPIAKTTIVKTRPPTIRNGRNSVVVSHKEFMRDYTSGPQNSFTSTKFPVQPGQSSVFPWLSAIAARYESYIFRKLEFVYEPAVATTTAGSIMMAIDFDAADAAPVSKTEIMSNTNAVRSSPWSRVRYNAATADLKKFGVQRYVRGALAPANTDIKTYDVGNLHVAYSGVPINIVLGELYVEYTVEFFTPQLNPAAVQVKANDPPAQINFFTIVADAIKLEAAVWGEQPLMWIEYQKKVAGIWHALVGTVMDQDTLLRMMVNKPNSKPLFLDTPTSWKSVISGSNSVYQALFDGASSTYSTTTGTFAERILNLRPIDESQQRSYNPNMWFDLVIDDPTATYRVDVLPGNMTWGAAFFSASGFPSGSTTFDDINLNTLPFVVPQYGSVVAARGTDQLTIITPQQAAAIMANAWKPVESRMHGMSIASDISVFSDGHLGGRYPY